MPLYDPADWPVWTWPGVDELEARLGVQLVDPADRADAAQAVDAAIRYAAQNSTRYHRWAEVTPPPPVDEHMAVPPDVWRGVVDLALALYERRGSQASDVFADVQPETRTHWRLLLGVGGYARPRIGGAV